jgi:hypothetical protein
MLINIRIKLINKNIVKYNTNPVCNDIINIFYSYLQKPPQHAPSLRPNLVFVKDFFNLIFFPLFFFILLKYHFFLNSQVPLIHLSTELSTD